MPFRHDADCEILPGIFSELKFAAEVGIGSDELNATNVLQIGRGFDFPGFYGVAVGCFAGGIGY